MKSKYSRKQMTPGMKYCKDTYGSKSGRIGTPFTKSSCSPMKGADANLVKGASDIAKAEIDATVSQKTTTETLAGIGQDQVNKYMGDDAIDFRSYGLNTDEQIQENLDAKV